MGRQEFLNRQNKAETKSKKNQSPAHQRSLKQEAMLAKRGNGKLTVGSGNKREKGDVKEYHGIFRVEAKCTVHNSFRVTKDMLTKIEDASVPHGELPAIIIEFIDKEQNVLQEVAVVPVYVLEQLGMS